MTSGSLWNYCRDKIDDVDDNVSGDKSFKHKIKILGKTPEKTKKIRTTTIITTKFRWNSTTTTTTTISTSFKC